MVIKTVSIIGLGALVTLYGHHLSKIMPKGNLRIIADSNRIARYKKTGIFCNGERCNFNFITPEENCEPADLLLFTVKFDGLQEAIESVKYHVGHNTIILSALNGISSEEIIGQTYGMEKILYCVAQGMDAVKIENKLTYANKGLLCFGEKEAGIVSEKVKSVADFFTRVELPHEIDTSMLHRLWGKFMLNVGVNQTVAVYKSNYGEVQRDGEARNTMIAAMREVIALSEKEGVSLTEKDLHYWLNVLGTLSPDGKPSMAQDVDAKRPSEVELFSGTVLRLGKKHGIPTPINKMLYDQFQLIESSYADF
ncbi:ketopantoate reductase family protein [Lysinibacillus telephonicus]|uniref:ketopantoate reductase family protein n=1 Tax=Lysinibacillus telephonicus TaxID=1714840 RepID=UPI003979A2E8